RGFESRPLRHLFKTSAAMLGFFAIWELVNNLHIIQRSLSASLYTFSYPYALSLFSVIPNRSLPTSGSYPFGFVVIAPLFGKDRLRYPYSAFW
ncbi:hypothetical protein ACOSZP_21545, partial [Vibrio fluvialis]|uniref:hypothetical protein n=1 Tax=Vibrio fluvialis TaxID=676 RepID=UPI003BA0ED2B